MHSHHGLLLSNAEEQTVDAHNSLNGSQGNLAECKKSTSKVHTAWFLQYIALLKWQNCRDEGKISSWQRFGVEGRREYKRKTRGIRTMEQVCILTVMADVQIHTHKATQSYTHTHKCLWNQGNLKKLCGWYQGISWFCSCTVVIQGANSGRNWVEGVQRHPVHLFVIPCESIIISK